MKKIYKKLRLCGHSPGLNFDKTCMSISEFQIGDVLELKCSKNKIILIKSDVKVDDKEEK